MIWFDDKLRLRDNESELRGEAARFGVLDIAGGRAPPVDCTDGRLLRSVISTPTPAMAIDVIPAALGDDGCDNTGKAFDEADRGREEAAADTAAARGSWCGKWQNTEKSKARF
mmetsp:Transcript_73435/g.203948  ORF Transcript_73435/g.203948 Transcript_73435/m.203948 type:complete len:113 (+) Transcript_73435:3234-3572(+)